MELCIVVLLNTGEKKQKLAETFRICMHKMNFYVLQKTNAIKIRSNRIKKC